MMKSIPSGATLGILGGGQLAMMAIEAAHALGYRVVVLEPDTQAPAARLADGWIAAAYNDPQALEKLAGQCVAVTTEFENVPAASLKVFEDRGFRVSPPSAAIGYAQDRRREKGFFESIGIPVGPYQKIESEKDCGAASEALFPAVLKTATSGYDGKGQARVAQKSELLAAFLSLGSVPSVLEKQLNLKQEISVVTARGSDGEVVSFPVFENQHEEGILDLTICPARVEDSVRDQAVGLTQKIIQGLGYVGVLCVEFFVVETNGQPQVLANEMAPRPHNSGHLTREACDYSQFSAQIKTLCGLKLGVPKLQSPAVMLNLLGKHLADPDALQAQCKEAGAFFTLYGKTEVRPARKMGHLTLLGPNIPRLLEQVRKLNREGLSSC